MKEMSPAQTRPRGCDRTGTWLLYIASGNFPVPTSNSPPGPFGTSFVPGRLRGYAIAGGNTP